MARSIWLTDNNYDISDLEIGKLEQNHGDFPVPEAGEDTKTFLGKVRKFITDFNSFKDGVITLGKLANNLQTTQDGFALDARAGKSLYDMYSKLNSDITGLNTNFALHANKPTSSFQRDYYTGIVNERQYTANASGLLIAFMGTFATTLDNASSGFIKIQIATNNGYNSPNQTTSGDAHYYDSVNTILLCPIQSGNIIRFLQSTNTSAHTIETQIFFAVL